MINIIHYDLPFILHLLQINYIRFIDILLMYNRESSSPNRKPENKKNDLSHLDCVFSLEGITPPGEEEEKFDIFRAPLMEFSEPDYSRSLNKLFECNEERTPYDPLDPQALPMLFREPKRFPSRKRPDSKPPPKCFEEATIKELLCGSEKLTELATHICNQAGLMPEYIIILNVYSPLACFVSQTQGTPAKCTLTELLTEVLRYTFQNIHDAVINEEYKTPEPECMNSPNLMSQETPMEMQTMEKHMEPLEDLTQSVAMSDIDSAYGNKRSHKAWTEEEENELIKLIQENKSTKIQQAKLEELSKKFNRSVCSLHAKAKAIGKKLMNQDLISKISSTSSSHDSKSYFDMISNILNNSHEHKATKREIITQISIKYGLDKDTIEKPVSQCLSKKFERCPGIFSLKDGIEIPSTKHIERFSIKERLIYLLGTKLPKKEGSLAQIRQIYQQEFKETLDTKISGDGNQAVWEKTIAKILTKFNEFDKTRSKTVYTFKHNPVLSL